MVIWNQWEWEWGLQSLLLWNCSKAWSVSHDRLVVLFWGIKDKRADERGQRLLVGCKQRLSVWLELGGGVFILLLQLKNAPHDWKQHSCTRTPRVFLQYFKIRLLHQELQSFMMRLHSFIYLFDQPPPTLPCVSQHALQQRSLMELLMLEENA